MIGRMVSQYRVLERLGAGGMGEVYLAEDSRLGRKVALKVLPAELARRPHFLSRFRLEARAVAAIQHPNIVTLYSVEEEEGVPFLTMEYVEGRTLAELIPPGGMGLDELLGIAIQVAGALAAAHERGIVHRDIKPRNLIVDACGRVKVLDFGIAKRLPVEDEPTAVLGQEMDTLTQEGQIIGTVSHMSPEQLQGHPLDPRSDLFSFGVVLYQMATGKLPFRGSTPAEQMVSILEGRVALPGVVRAGLPRRFDEIVARCLERDPRQRYQSACVLCEDLEALRRDPVSVSRPVTTLPAAPPAPAPRVSRRKLAAGAALLVSIAAGSAYLLRLVPDSVFGAASASVRGKADLGLAVLPLENLSKEEEYFVDGLTEALIASMGRMGRVRVISRQSVMRYKGSDKPLPTIARELGVDLVLTGSVMRAGPRVRITAQLIQADPEEQLWAESYRRDLQDILSLQDEVAREVAREVRLELTQQERDRLTQARAVDPVAYELYLQGRYQWDKRTPEALRKAAEYFEQAIAKDPSYAAAHVGLADTYALLGFFRREPPDRAFARARAEVSRALALDGNLAEAHASLGYVKLFYDWDGSGAERDLRRALELNPSYASAHHWLYAYLSSVGRLDEAERHLNRARELNPFSPTINTALAGHLFMIGDLDGTIAQSRKAVDLEPSYSYSYETLWVGLQEKGKTDEAFRAFERVLSIEVGSEIAQAARGIYEKSGYRAALAGTGDLLAASSQGEIRLLATIYLLADEDGKALDQLDRALERREPFLLWVRYYRDWKRLRGNPRFERILEQVDRLRS